MTRTLTQRGLARVREFVADWHSSRLERTTTEPERALIEEALVDYLLDESSISTPASTTAQEGLDALRVLCADPANEVAATVASCLAELRQRLDNQEDDNLIMREHLVMLSEHNRRLRAGARTVLSEK